MWKTRLFASELGSLLLSGLSMQDSLDVLINQNLDPVLSEIANEIKNSVIYGEPFDKAVAITDGLTKQFSAFVEHGTNSGHLPKELIIYSEYLENKLNKHFIKRTSCSSTGSFQSNCDLYFSCLYRIVTTDVRND